MKLQKLLFLLLIGSTVAFADNTDFDPVTDRLGCGTIVSMRKVNQKAIEDSRYVPRVSTGQGVVAGVLNIFGVGLLGSVIGEVATVVAMDSAKTEAHAKKVAKEEETQNFKHVIAMRFKFDDDREVNLPVQELGVHRWKEGVRIVAYYSKKRDAIQFSTNPHFANIPAIGDPNYSEKCSNLFDKEVSDALIARSSSLVDESKIIHEQ